MPTEGTARIVAVAIAVAIILGGLYGFRRAQLAMAARIVVGLLMLASGIALAHWLVQGSNEPLIHPVRLGLAAGFIGLGINQVAAPLRAAMGKPA